MQNQEPAAAGTGIGRDRAHWEQEAANWVKWTRKPGHDPYWHYSPAFFQELVPPTGPGHSRDRLRRRPGGP
jgi:hypothetical protein